MEYDREQQTFSAASRDASTPGCEILFRKPEKYAKNIAQEHPVQNIITSFFQMLKMTELLPNRLSTSLAISKSDQAFPRSSLHIMFFGNDAELKLRLHRKQLEAAKDRYFAGAEKLGRWRGIKNGMSTRGTPRMRRTQHLRRRSMRRQNVISTSDRTANDRRNRAWASAISSSVRPP